MSQQRLSADEYARGVIAGERVMLGRAITLIESTLPADMVLAEELLHKVLPHSGKSLRLGITGVPGVGKSTFIDSFGSYIIEQKKGKVAVLAIDPSSVKSKGSILGDKTRMYRLSNNPSAFIRPTASGGTLGGVAARSRETMMLCEAAGFDHIIVETVGVGQSETMVSEMVDFFLLLMLAGAGDELQGIKRGIMELCHALVINKADGDNTVKAAQTAREYANALHLLQAHESGWTAKTGTCSALNDEGMAQVYSWITEYQVQSTISGFFEENRKQQLLGWMDQLLKENLYQHFENYTRGNTRMQEVKSQLLEGKISVRKALQDVLLPYFNPGVNSR